VRVNGSCRTGTPARLFRGTSTGRSARPTLKLSSDGALAEAQTDVVEAACSDGSVDDVEH
jgi:hypothetical protein